MTDAAPGGGPAHGGAHRPPVSRPVLAAAGLAAFSVLWSGALWFSVGFQPRWTVDSPPPGWLSVLAWLPQPVLAVLTVVGSWPPGPVSGRRLGAATLALTVAVGLLCGYVYPRAPGGGPVLFLAHLGVPVLSLLAFAGLARAGRRGPAPRAGVPAAAPAGGGDGRSLFEETAERAIAARTGEGVSLALIHLDDVTVPVSRPIGEVLMMAVAERLRSGVRPEDLVARLGGVGFAVLLSDIHPDLVDPVAERMLSVLSRPFEFDGRPIRVRASIGVADAGPGDGLTVVLRRAGLAMADAKAPGSGGYARRTSAR